jgi:hypothetical protein
MEQWIARGLGMVPAPDIILAEGEGFCSPLWTSTVVPATVEMKWSPFDKCLKTVGIPSQNH